jgi:hypothetical protein
MVLRGAICKVGYRETDDQRQFIGLVDDVRGDSDHLVDPHLE